MPRARRLQLTPQSADPGRAKPTELPWARVAFDTKIVAPVRALTWISEKAARASGPAPREGLLTAPLTGTFGEATLEPFNVSDQAQLHRLEAGVLVEAPCCRILGAHAAGH